MNRQESDILKALMDQPYSNQRILAEASGHSLGIVNRSLKSLILDGYLTEDKQLTQKAHREMASRQTKSAVILAAGYGMRMVPINTEIPKGLLEVNGETLIERLIMQLHEVHITEIYVVVGFLKEQYEYLIDKYNVILIVNPEYSTKNNLFSLYRALPYLRNSYIIPCDIWCRTNPFHMYEMYSWYMMSDVVDRTSMVHINRNMELVSNPKGEEGNRMIGICYLDQPEAEILQKKIEGMIQNVKYHDSFWETALLKDGKMFVYARVVCDEDVYEINTLEQLRELDSNSAQLQARALEIIMQTFAVKLEDIIDITVLKKGMTNRSFLFRCKDKKYIMRIPGEGTDKLINRRQETEVYKVIGNNNISDKIIYINADNGYKITEYMENARVCNPQNAEDVKCCMEKLREFHNMRFQVKNEFNLFEQIDFYESLWGNEKSVYRDYPETKKRVYELKAYIDAQPKETILSHIDSVPDNFLFTESGEIKLIDWEYAGMQDPHVDIAMFAVYSFYNKEQIDTLINIYFAGDIEDAIRIKIYCYVAVCGLLWSNWSEYKQQLGIELGEYSIRQYRYAKEFYKIAKAEMRKMEVEN